MPAAVAVLIAAALAQSQAVQAAPPAAPPASDDTVERRFERMQKDIDALRQQNAAQAERITQLETQTGEQWLSEQRASQIRGIVADVMADSQTRASLQASGATSGFDGNFFIASADGNFRLNIEGQMQIRFAFNHLPTAGITPPVRGQVQNEYGFELRRMRLNFFGHVFDPSWTYRMQFSFNRDAGAVNRNVALDDAFVQKAFGDGFYTRVGQWKSLFNYEEITSSRTQQFIARSLVNGYYSQDFIQGVLLGWESSKVRLSASYNDGGGMKNVAVLQRTGNPTQWALSARADWLLAGQWGQMKDMQGWVGSPFAAMIGGGLNWQRAGGNPPPSRQSPSTGLLADGVFAQNALLSYTIDGNLRGDGWSAWAAFLGNWTTATGSEGAARGLSNVLSYGMVVQGGLFVTEEVELIGRYEGLWVVSGNSSFGSVAGALLTQNLNIVTLGANWYIDKNDLKLTVDGGWAFEPVLFSNGLYGDSISGTNWRASQTGAGAGELVLRAQLQILF
jgi:hypothetical protein